MPLRPRDLAGIGLAAVALNVAVRAGVATPIAAGCAVGVGALIRTADARRPEAWPRDLTSLAVILVAVLMPWRASSWLAHLNGWTALALIALLAIRTHTELAWGTAVAKRTIRRVLTGFDGPLLLLRSLRPLGSSRWSAAAPLLRGAAIAALPLLVLGSLLASADAIFAELLTPNLRLDAAVSHLAVTATAAVALASLVTMRRAPEAPDDDDTRPLGHVEADIVFGTVAALFAAFVAVQLWSATGDLDGVLARSGVTRADYARSGYFQLLWVAGLTALLLLGVRLFDERGIPTAWRSKMLAATVCLLTTGIVIAALLRLDQYVDAFGQTTLRWYSGAFAWLLGVGFVIAAIAHVTSTRWLPNALIALTVGALVVVNGANPEARIARHNLERPAAAVPVDVPYLLGLSADAWPVIGEHLSQLERAESRSRLLSACHGAAAQNGWGPLGANFARARLDCDALLDGG